MKAKMPNLPYSIELHDSEISAILNVGGSVVVKFSHAYIHKDGQGWSQKLDFVINEASLKCDQTSFPAKLGDGRLRTNKGPYHNLLELPLDVDGEVKLKLEFFSEAVAEVTGTGLSVVFHSEPVFIEKVPEF